jgi:CoA:oxalate CoA-transferase
MTKAFEGVRILEFAQVISGPFASTMLGFLGADVIKVEPRGDGDQSRKLIASGPLAEAGVPPLFQGLNPGKRSIAIDLKNPEAREVVHRLVRTADVVIENSRPGAIERMGYGYEALRQVREDLIYCSISGYGQEGPRSKLPAYDGAIQASSGMMSVSGHEGEGPMKVGFAVVDNATALNAALAIASALFRRTHTGEGQYLDVSMFDSALSLMMPVVAGYLIGGEVPRQLGNQSLTRQPTANAFPTAGGNIQVNALTAKQAELFCHAIGRGDLMDDERFSTPAARRHHNPEMRSEIITALAAKSAAEWEAELNAAGVPTARIADVPTALEDPQLEYRDIIIKLPPPLGVEGPASQVVNVGFKAEPGNPGATHPAPLLGQHTGEILAELGYDEAEVASLRESGIV